MHIDVTIGWPGLLVIVIAVYEACLACRAAGGVIARFLLYRLRRGRGG